MVTKTVSENSFQDNGALLEQRILERKILRTVLYYTPIIPSNEDYILVAFVNAIVEYVTGKVSSLSRYGYGIKFRAWNYYHRETRAADKKLNSQIKKAVDSLVDISTQTKPRFCAELKLIMFNAHWVGGYLSGKTFKLSTLQIKDIESEIIPSLSEEVREELETIAKLMHKYIE